MRAAKLETWFSAHGASVRFWIAAVMLILAFVFGGSARTDSMGLIVLQPMAVILAAASLLLPGPVDWQRIRFPIFFLAALAALIGAQLVPLPPEMFSSLPGHEQFIPRYDGLANVWRPLSLTPDLTMASLVGLVVPAAVLLCIAALPAERVRDLLPVLIGLALVSAILGLMQIAGGTGSAAYTHRVTNKGFAVGLFANRNHQALFLACAFPMLAVWLKAPSATANAAKLKLIAAGAIGLFLTPMVLATGSRAGIALAVLGMIFSLGLLSTGRAGRQDPGSRRARRLMLGGFALAALLIAGAAVLLSRASAVQRLGAEDLVEDDRVTFAPHLWRSAQDFFPAGAGFGSFDRVNRFYEPFDLLKTSYLNHAHNEPLELLITGGLPAVLLAVVFIGWLFVRGVSTLRQASSSVTNLYGRLGLAIATLCLLSSIVDYPIRTPAIAALLALAIAWSADRSTGRKRVEHESPTAASSAR